MSSQLLNNQSISLKPTITAFENSPDHGQGQARDMRVRWALVEVSQPYDVRLVSFKEMKQPAHLAIHPFGQIPTYEEGDLALFESGAIVFHIAERHAGLLPNDANARARAITWMFAALNTVEPPLIEYEAFALFERDKSWYEQRLPILENHIRVRLGALSTRLGQAEWLEGEFSAGDLMMVGVLFRSQDSGIMSEYRTFVPMSPAAKDGPRSGVLSPHNWRFSLTSHRADIEILTKQKGDRS